MVKIGFKLAEMEGEWVAGSSKNKIKLEHELSSAIITVKYEL